MWKDYSISYMKNNRSSSISIMVAAFISALLLSLLCCLFFNVWQYDVEQIVLEEGDWQGRIGGALGDEDFAMIENFGNVKKVVINEKLSKEQDVVADIYFHNPRTIYQDMPLIRSLLGLKEEAITYHDFLLSRYLIHNPLDDTQPLLLTFYLLLLFVTALALMMIIRNSFAVSMNARIHQFGIFSSIGATPGQIRLCLIQEAAVLCLPSILLGDILGIAFSYELIQIINVLVVDAAGRRNAVFQYHPFIFAGTILVSVLTVFFSAWLPARQLSRLTPLAAIGNVGDIQVKKKKRSPLLSFLFGIEGELAAASLRVRKKALRTTMLSLTLSFLAFTVFFSFTAFSRLSVHETSFSRYQDFWDIMVTVKDTSIAEFKDLDPITALENVESPVLYQKAEAYTMIPSLMQSEELAALGGLPAVDGEAVPMEGEQYVVKVPIVILDDAGFVAYCKQIGMEPQTSGGIMINKIWDSLHSNFRNREYVPFMKETQSEILLRNRSGEASVAIPIIGYTAEEPVLWEQYDDYALVQILPLSIWNTISEKIEFVEADSYLRILAFDDADLNDDMATIQEMLESLYTIEIHNRVQDLAADKQLWQGLNLLMSAGCILLAMIGIANIFSHTLGFVHQRKREFAQYLSIGVTPRAIKKILWIEALTIAGRPIIITLPLTALVMIVIIKASYMEISQFLPVAPVLPILIYIAAIFFFVGFAYYLGERRLLRSDLSEILRNDATS